MDAKKILIDTDSETFRMKSGKYLLTFPLDHHDKDQLMEYYEGVFKDNRFLRCAHHTVEIPVDSIEDVITDEALKNTILDKLEETDEVFELKNTYMLIDATGSRMDLKNSNVLVYEELDVKPIVEKFKTTKDFDKMKYWFGKIDQDNKDLQPPKPLYDLVADCKTLKEALRKYATEPKDISGIKQLFEITRRDTRLTENTYEPNLPWQFKFLEERIEKKPNYRKITWYYDKDGDSGKTSLGRYLKIKYPNDWASHNDLSTMYHAATIITNEIHDGWTQHGICINLTRGSENHRSFYQVLEAIKDGQITAVKYSGGTTIFNPPHLIIFSNFLPKVHFMSKDRWDIREITPEKDVIELPVNTVLERQREEALKIQNGEMDAFDENFNHTFDVSSIQRAIGTVKSPEYKPVFAKAETVINVKTPTRKTRPIGKIDPTAC